MEETQWTLTWKYNLNIFSQIQRSKLLYKVEDSVTVVLLHVYGAVEIPFVIALMSLSWFMHLWIFNEPSCNLCKICSQRKYCKTIPFLFFQLRFSQFLKCLIIICHGVNRNKKLFTWFGALYIIPIWFLILMKQNAL